MIEREFPPFYPFRYFIDVYIFLDRILYSGSVWLKDIESRHKLDLWEMIVLILRVLLERSQEYLVAVLLSTFQLSRMNQGLLSLPYLLFKNWEESKPNKGLKDLIKRKMINIKIQIRSNIHNMLPSHEIAMLLEMTCLDSTKFFVTSLLTYLRHSANHDWL